MHPNLWKFIRTLQDLQCFQELEEISYVTGGMVASKMSKKNREKEIALKTLRELFLQSHQTPSDAFDYVHSVSLRMRRYNLARNGDDDDDVDDL